MIVFEPSGDLAGFFDPARPTPLADQWAERWSSNWTAQNRPHAPGWPDLYQTEKDLLRQAALLPDLDLARQYIFALDLCGPAPGMIICCARHFEATNSAADPDDPIARLLPPELAYSALRPPATPDLARALFNAGFSWSRRLQLRLDELFEAKAMPVMLSIIEALSIEAALAPALAPTRLARL